MYRGIMRKKKLGSLNIIPLNLRFRIKHRTSMYEDPSFIHSSILSQREENKIVNNFVHRKIEFIELKFRKSWIKSREFKI